MVEGGGVSARSLGFCRFHSEAPCIHSARVLMDRHVTRDPELLFLVSRWRARVQELLAQAETMRDAEARQMMQEIAAKYERLAQQVDQRASGVDKV